VHIILHTVILAQSVNGIYDIEVKRSRCLRSVSDRDSAALWHRRFGHLGYESLQRLAKENMVTDCLCHQTSSVMSKRRSVNLALWLCSIVIVIPLLQRGFQVRWS
jgi:hypothetical protein